MAKINKNNGDSEIEDLIDQYPEEKDVYRYMRNEYDKYEDTYLEENADVIEEKVTAKVIEKFGISPDEAHHLYTVMKFRIAKLQKGELDDNSK
ncbi:hypothetical protein Q8G32_28750 [Priestia megaterium]|uniref:hypothetical protein n=1 Tax=Priestia megaterium TaxID=1404 RepID=UPI00272FFAB2|nr:hypothetical protein [Priestia megaterium]MDP1471832.1 hypothetical protein [Priestia megaterium]